VYSTVLPVAVRVVGVVAGVVVVGGTVVVGLVVGVVGLVVVEEGVVVDAGGAPATLEGEEPPGKEAAGSEPGARDADLVWKLSTPARPATVAPITIGARLMGSWSSEWTWGLFALTP
jgi:hypothetical protein